MNTRIAQLIALTLSTSAIGCAGAYPAPVSTPTEASAPTPDQAGRGMCTVVRRGESRNGVRDARIAEHWPAKNYGMATSSFAGTVAGGARQTLLAFELPEIPEGAVITSAKVRLHKFVCGGNGASAHRVTRAWDEHTVTWNSFGAAYEATPVNAIPVGAPEHTSIDITELARGWASGDVENHGVVLTQENANTAFSTSEAGEPTERPTLEICWTSAS